MNIFPSFWVWDAALDWMHRWVRKGEKPPSAPALQSTMDQYGNEQGGLRIQDIDVPIATYTKSNTAMSSSDFLSDFACALSGSVVPLTSQQLLQAYPTHDAYVQTYTQAADKALAAGFLLQADHDIAIQMAKAAPIPN
jgi:Alpha/beta hydrolase domain